VNDLLAEARSLQQDAMTAPGRADRPPRKALVLMGGGARTAYQAGALQALANLLPADKDGKFPFDILVGTSAGALNATFLASQASTGGQAFYQLAAFWTRLRSHQVYQLPRTALSQWGRWSRWATALGVTLSARQHGAALDSMPLVNTLHHVIDLPAIDRALAQGAIQALAVTASSYSSGVHWTFCQTAEDSNTPPWSRPGRRADMQPITIEHLMASSAIPFLFPATPLWVDDGLEYFGDGSMRQISPLSPTQILAIGVGQPHRNLLDTAVTHHRPPTLGGIAGHALASVFHDTLQADVEQIEHLNASLSGLSDSVRRQLPFNPVQVLTLHPSASLDALAQAHVQELPTELHRVLNGMGALSGGGAALSSYLLFEPGFVQALMQLGAADVMARRAEFLAFLAPAAA
jgi:NTE family protein